LGLRPHLALPRDFPTQGLNSPGAAKWMAPFFQKFRINE
jgi:hypothetical protein